MTSCWPPSGRWMVLAPDACSSSEMVKSAARSAAARPWRRRRSRWSALRVVGEGVQGVAVRADHHLAQVADLRQIDHRPWPVGRRSGVPEQAQVQGQQRAAAAGACAAARGRRPSPACRRPRRRTICRRRPGRWSRPARRHRRRSTAATCRS